MILQSSNYNPLPIIYCYLQHDQCCLFFLPAYSQKVLAYKLITILVLYLIAISLLGYPNCYKIGNEVGLGFMDTNIDFPKVTTGEGVTRQVLSHNEELMTVEFVFAENGVGDLHSHPHIQSTYVKSGSFLFTIDGQEYEITSGDSLIIPSNAVHGCKALTNGALIDTFTPRRDDFL